MTEWTCSRGRRRALVWALCVAALTVGLGRTARADVVDEAFSRGAAAAQRGDWQAAARSFEEAEGLLPGRSAVLSYDLGTSYAHLGANGHAIFHLRRALQPEAGPTAEVAEAARRNLGIVRQRVEQEATNSGAQIDRPETGWELVLSAVRGVGVGWLALGSGWLALALWWITRRVRSSGSEPGRGAPGVLGSVIVVLAILYGVVGTLHGLAVRAERISPPAIVLESAAVHEAPGEHRKQRFTVQSGSKVRIVGRTRGWCQIRLSGGLEGWLPEDAVGELNDGGPRRLARARSRPATG
ncbi:MAG: SH3 domain-containing protein [Nannocystaceae bacterium]